jgi:hypothetical protein
MNDIFQTGSVSAVHSPSYTDDGEFSLSDLVNEYLLDGPSSTSINEKLTSLSITNLNKSKGTDHTAENSIHLSSPVTSTILPFVTNTSTLKTPLESILFPNQLASNNAGDADSIWKETSSLFGQMLCTKIPELRTIATKQISTCLFNRSLYERLRECLI